MFITIELKSVTSPTFVLFYALKSNILSFIK